MAAAQGRNVDDRLGMTGKAGMWRTSALVRAIEEAQIFVSAWFEDNWRSLDGR